MDIEQFQAIEIQLSKQAEATCSTNETLAQLFTHMRTTEAKRVTMPPSVPTILSILHTSWIGLGVLNNFNRDQSDIL
jgi:hypothetical protein